MHVLNHPLTLRFLNLGAFLFSIFFNASPNFEEGKESPDDGHDGGLGEDREGKDPTATIWIAPARYAFTIWFLIYALVLGFVGIQLLPWTWMDGWEVKALKGAKEVIGKRVGYLFVLLCFLNSFWLYCYSNHYHVLSFYVILAMTLTVAAIYYRVHPFSRGIPFGVLRLDDRNPILVREEGRPLIAVRNVKKEDGWIVRVFVGITFAMYTGWLICASTVSLFTVYLRIDPAKPLATLPYGIIALVLLSLFASVILHIFQDMTIPLVAIWALTSIPNNGAVEKYPEGAWYIRVSADSCAAFVAFGVGVLFVLRVAALSRRFVADI
ncbi:hypothetical protein HDU97_004423 [Phlyctochytrium planicorne]|nr:hypothetical protein HDU97_004423 [Phlyctochytrium planicorne]